MCFFTPSLARLWSRGVALSFVPLIASFQGEWRAVCCFGAVWCAAVALGLGWVRVLFVACGVVLGCGYIRLRGCCADIYHVWQYVAACCVTLCCVALFCAALGCIEVACCVCMYANACLWSRACVCECSLASTRTKDSTLAEKRLHTHTHAQSAGGAFQRQSVYDCDLRCFFDAGSCTNGSTLAPISGATFCGAA